MSAEPPHEAFNAAVTAANDDEVVTAASKTSKLAIAGKTVAGGFAVAGIIFNFKDAYEQVQLQREHGNTGRAITGAIWTGLIKNTPEVATLAEALAVGGRTLTVAKTASSIRTLFLLEAGQQVINETTGLVPPSMLSYGMNWDINASRAREALFPGDATAESTARRQYEEDEGIVANPEFGLMPGDMMKVINEQYPEPAVDKLLASMPNFTTFNGNYKVYDPAKKDFVPHVPMNLLTKEMYRLEQTGKPEDHQRAREMFRNFMINEVTARAEEVALERHVIDWKNERVPQEIFDEVAPQVIRGLTGDMTNNKDGRDIGLYGTARVEYIKNAVLYLNPAYDNKSPQTVKTADGKPVSMLQAASQFLDEYVANSPASFKWDDPAKQLEIRQHINSKLAEYKYVNIPDANRNMGAPQSAPASYRAEPALPKP